MILVDQKNYHLCYHRVTDIHSKWPTESDLVSQGVAIESEGYLFKCHLVLCQAEGLDLFTTLLVTLRSKTVKKE